MIQQFIANLFVKKNRDKSWVQNINK